MAESPQPLSNTNIMIFVNAIFVENLQKVFVFFMANRLTFGTFHSIFNPWPASCLTSFYLRVTFLLCWFLVVWPRKIEVGGEFVLFVCQSLWVNVAFSTDFRFPTWKTFFRLDLSDVHSTRAPQRSMPSALHPGFWRTQADPIFPQPVLSRELAVQTAAS